MCAVMSILYGHITRVDLMSIILFSIELEMLRALFVFPYTRSAFPACETGHLTRPPDQASIHWMNTKEHYEFEASTFASFTCS